VTTGIGSIRLSGAYVHGLIGLLLAFSVQASAQPSSPTASLARTILTEMIAARTTVEGSTTPLVASLAERFRAAGVPAADVMVLGAGERNRNLVVRLRGRDRAALPRLFLAHLDVVGVDSAAWRTNPWALTERDEMLYGRGVQDDKGPAAALSAAFLDLVRRKIVPERDLILALTAGEESGEDNGVDWLVKNRPELVRAEFVVNADGGGGEVLEGRPIAFNVQAAEKVYLDLTLTARGPGGHSSLPDGPSPIDRLAGALDRVGRHTFPVRLTPVVQEYLRQRAPLAGGETGTAMAALARDPRDTAAATVLARSPQLNATLRTTCISTLLRGGTAPNAIPSAAEANVNCRIVPTDPADSVRAVIQRLVAPFDVEVTVRWPATASPPSILPPTLRGALEATLRETVGVVPVIPYMEMGATDGVYLRNAGIPVFGVIGLFVPEALVATAHANDERVPLVAYEGLVEFTRRLVERLAR
jgi:acetylornithine deacetylase/succinyl-diaminopimelate desuccinylase-like protein